MTDITHDAPRINIPECNDIIDAYLQFVSGTEPPETFYRWSMIASIAALLKRNFWINHGATKIYPNMYLMLMGVAGTRKSTAIKRTVKLLKEAGYDQIAADKSSKEKFLLDLAQGHIGEAFDVDNNVIHEDKQAVLESMLTASFTDGNMEPKCCLVAADEFNEFIGTNNIDFLSTLGNLWDYDGTFRGRTKNAGSIQLVDPTITILGGNTPTNFQLAFPPEAMGQGFLSRMLLIHSEPSTKKIAFPPVPNPTDTEFLVNYLKHIEMNVHGEAIVTAEAKHRLTYIYENTGTLDDPRLASYCNRRFTHLLKLCLIMAAARISTTIEEKDVMLANSLLTMAEYYMPHALGEYGMSKHWRITTTVLDYLNDCVTQGKPGALPRDIIKKLSSQLSSPTEFATVLEILTTAGKVKSITIGDVKYIIPVKVALEVSKEGLYDFNLIRSFSKES